MGSRFRCGLRYCVSAAAGLVFSGVLAGPFTPGNLVVLRVGDGSAALTATGTAVFLDEYTTAGTLVQTVALPTTVSGSNRRFVLSGSASSEGVLTRSVNGLFLTCFGYDAAIGASSLTGSSAATFNRVVARVAGSGSIDTTTALTDAPTGASPRGAVSTDGTSLWLCGGANGPRYTTLGASTSVQLATTPTNLRVSNIFSGQLYVSTSSGLYSVGTGLPMSSGNTATLLNGFPGSMTSLYDFYFANASTIYACDDSSSSTGGIYKFTLSGFLWTGNVFNDTVGSTCRQLTGTKNSSGQVVLYFTTTQASQPSLIRKLVDTGFSAQTSIVAFAPTNTVFRGIDFAPVAPLANSDGYATSPGQQLAVGSPGVLANDLGPGDPGYGFTAVLDTTVPAGHSLTLNPNGSFTYTPPTGFSGQVTFTYHANDGFASSAPATVTINVPNTAPTLEAIASPQTIDENTLLTFTAVGHDADAGQTLTYTIEGAPAGAAINPGSGVFTWTPTEAQGPGTYTFTVRVTDDGSPNLSASQSVQVNVNEVNSPPTLSNVPANLVGDEGVEVTFDASATDSDVPANTLTFSLEGAPAGATIDPATGYFSWTPTEQQGGNPNTVYNFSVKVTDNGSPNLADTKPVQITVNEVNQPPVLDPIGDKTATVGSTLTFTAQATDSDVPANTLTFSLSGAPLGATIDPNTGAFSWTPAVPGSYTFDVVVTDNGSPNLSDSETIRVDVGLGVTTQAVLTVELQGVQLPIGQTLRRWLHITLGGGGGPNAPVEIDTVADFIDTDGTTGDPARAVITLNNPVPANAPPLSSVAVTDKLHTITKKKALTTVSSGFYSSSFTGADGLQSGDANNDNVIDIIDFAIFAVHLGENVGADTAIGQGFSNGQLVVPHPDFSGNGIVDTPDYTFFFVNFGLVGDSPPGGFNPRLRAPTKIVSVKELLANHVLQAWKLDINGDGWVTIAEIQQYLLFR